MNNNFYNYPYYYTNGLRNIYPTSIPMYTANSPLSFLTKASPLSQVAKTTKFSFSSLLNGASKTLGVINQAIPVVNQVKPIWNNAKTMFRMAKIINSDDKKEEITKENNTKVKETIKETNVPTFFN